MTLPLSINICSCTAESTTDLYSFAHLPLQLVPPFLALLGMQLNTDKHTSVLPASVYPLSMQTQGPEAPSLHADSKTAGSTTCPM